MKILTKFWIYGLLIVIALVASTNIILAQGEADRLRNPVIPHPVADEAISRLKSPYCPGLMLEVCTSYQGALLRDSLQAMAREGKNTEDLVNWVLANHGEEYLAYPNMSGRGLLAWIVPPGVLILGIGMVIVTLRYMKDPIGAKVGVGKEFSEEDEILLREALREMDVEEGPIF